MTRLRIVNGKSYDTREECLAALLEALEASCATPKESAALEHN